VVEKQPIEAINALKINRLSITDALDAFSAHFDWTKIDRIWCHGAAFDLAMMRHHEKRLQWVQPYKYKQERCFRTAFDMGKTIVISPFDRPEYAGTLIRHRADHDAAAQAWILQRLEFCA
jgi:hypothetical protein